MAFDANRFLNVAHYLLDDATLDNREALQRTAVGRLYYTAFFQARTFVQSRGVRAATVGAVVGVLDGLPGMTDIGLMLRQLHAIRNQCDYDDSHD